MTPCLLDNIGSFVGLGWAWFWLWYIRGATAIDMAKYSQLALSIGLRKGSEGRRVGIWKLKSVGIDEQISIPCQNRRVLLSCQVQTRSQPKVLPFLNPSKISKLPKCSMKRTAEQFLLNFCVPAVDTSGHVMDRKDGQLIDLRSVIENRFLFNELEIRSK